MDSIGGLHTKSLCLFSCFGMDGAAHWEFGFGLNPMYNKARGCISGYILDSAHSLVLNLFFSFISICFFFFLKSSFGGSHWLFIFDISTVCRLLQIFTSS